MNHIGNLVETAYYVRDSIKSKISDDHGHNYKWYESAVRELEELKEKLTNESQINIGTDAQEAHTHTTASRKGIEESLSMYSDI
jgi:hypothetical protein